MAHRTPPDPDDLRPPAGSARGLLLSALPSTVLAPLNALAGPAAAVAFAAALATVIAVARVRRGERKGPASGGLVGVVIAGILAWSTGSDSGLFLPDLAWYSIAAAVLTGSILIRRPLVGVLWALVSQPESARRAAARGRDFTLATALLAAVAVIRFVVTDLLAADHHDVLLITLKVASGFPLTLTAFAVATWAWRRASPANQRGKTWAARPATCQ